MRVIPIVEDEVERTQEGLHVRALHAYSAPMDESDYTNTAGMSGL